MVPPLDRILTIPLRWRPVRAWRAVTLYEVLGASRDASEDDLRRAYRAAARELHPDVNPDAATSDAMRRLNAAWAVLGNPDRRREYDRGDGPGAGGTRGAT